MKLNTPIAETARALAFLTRLPMPNSFFENGTHNEATQSAGYYPAAGIVIGLFGGAALVVTGLLHIPPSLSAAIAIITVIILTGALHEDGLGDIADGFGGGANKERRLEIMKDSRLGTYGVIAVISSLLLRVTALAAILQASGIIAACFAMIAASAASRGAMVWMWSDLPSARMDGVSGRLGKPHENAVSIAAITGLGSALIFGVLGSGFIAATIAIALSVTIMIGFQKLCLKMIGGQTGDTLGACQQLVETTMLIGLAGTFAITM
jgi:adenosylcobinamide-GDP ribazoletransferase